MTAHVTVFDTTLRDGEQSPGATMNTEQKIEVARQLARLGVDIIEAGFPVASPGDLDAVRRIAKEVKGLTVLGLARTSFTDIDAAWEAAARRLAAELGIGLIGRSKGQKIVLDRDWVLEQLEVEGRQLRYQQFEGSFTQPNGGVNRQMLAWLRGEKKAMTPKSCVPGTSTKR